MQRIAERAGVSTVQCWAALLCGAFLGVLFIAGASPVRAESGPIGQPFVVASDALNDLTDPVIAYNTQREEFLVAWEVIPGSFNMTQLTLTGELAWDPATPVVSVVGERPAIAYNEAMDEYLVVYQWHDGTYFDIHGLRLDGGSPTAIGPIGFVVSDRFGNQENPAVDYNRHASYEDFFVVWEDVNTAWVPAHEEIWGQRVAGVSGGGLSGGDLLGGNFGVGSSGVNTEPDVAYNLNMNEYLVVFTRQTASGQPKDVFGRRVTRDGVLLTETAIDSSAEDQMNPAVAAYRLNMATPYLVVFDDYWNDASGDVRGYLVNQTGEPTLLLNIAHQNGVQEASPALVSDEDLGGYFVVWTQFGNDWDVFATRISHEGLVEPFSNISVHGPTAVPCNETAPAVAAGPPLGLAVWQDSCLGGSGPLRIVGRFLSGGFVFADNFELGDTTAWSQTSP